MPQLADGGEETRSAMMWGIKRANTFRAIRHLLAWVVSAAMQLCATIGAEPPGYYATTAGLTGMALRAELHNIIKGHTSVGYNQSDEAMLITDETPGDATRVVLLYSRRNELKVHFVGNGNPTPNPVTAGWNREHQWPDSLGIDGREPLYSDLFNLRPADVDVNSDRGNLYYDESTTGTGYQNPANAEATLCTQDSNSWEPPAEVKGDIARSMFYMDVRYEGDGGEANLQLTDNTTLIGTSAAYMGKLSTLLVWHFIDPVSAAERTRGELVYGFQHNRNPFIDHPEFVEAVFGEVFKLRLTVNGGAATLTWPAIVPADMGVIEVSTNLSSWSPAAVAVVDQGGYHTAVVPLGATAKYYRLKLQVRAG